MTSLKHAIWCRLTRPNWLVLRIHDGKMDLLCNGCRKVKTLGRVTTQRKGTDDA